ncbi:MAG: type II toxin-antitoxin system PemK/MazF family toxin [Sphingomonas fennica]
MRRGSIVIAADRGDFSGKPRPYVVVQATAALEGTTAITLCPITTHLTGAALMRVPVLRLDGTGLLEASEIEVDRIRTIRRSRVKAPIGAVSDDILKQVDAALRRWLEL